MNILIIHGHPETDALGTALANAYEQGAKDANHNVKALKLREMDFDAVLRHRSRRFENVEQDILDARDAISWADHIVVQYPVWWASTPALLKGFFDRTFVPGFAYQYHDKGNGWDKLLKGKSGRLLVTMDAPVFFDTLLYFGSARRAVSKGVMWFCGIKPARVSAFGSAGKASDTKRQKWIDSVRVLGSKGI